MKSKTSRTSRENRETRQIMWVERNGYYKKRFLFFIIVGGEKFHLYLFANKREVALMDYSTFKDAKRGAERFLKSLQEAVK